MLIADEPLRCSYGHAIPTDQWAWPHGGVRCRYKAPPARSSDICGCVLYVLALPGGVRVVVEVTSSELHEMERARMDLDQARVFLGLKWARAA